MMQIFRAIVILCQFIILSSQAQFNKAEDFGKNRLQYDTKIWRHVSSENFIFYYYDAGYQVATFAANYAEEHFENICNTVGYFPYEKMKILIYTNTNDLQQSNIGIYYQSFNRKGQTSFVRSEIEIAYPGNRQEFENKLILSIADRLIFNMIYGESFKDALKSSLLISLQPWFLSGAAKYIAEGWTSEMEDYLRYAIPRKHFRKLQRLENQEAQLMGQAIWNYIAIKYGIKKISNVLNLTRITRNERKSLSNQLRISYEQLIKNTETYYQNNYAMVTQNYILPSKANRLFRSFGQVSYSDLAISPDEKFLAIAQNRKGALKIKLYNLKKGKRKNLIRTSYQIVNQEINKTVPLVDWRGINKLGTFTLNKERNYFYSINIDKNRKEYRYFRTVNNIQSFEIHPNGNEFILSGEINAKSNIYQYFYTDRKFYKLTDDKFDDEYPTYLHNDKSQIIFSSNRPIETKDSIYQKNPDLFKDIYNLFIYTPSKPYRPGVLGKIEPLTRSLNINSQPKKLNEDEIIFLSDQTGIMNLYKYDLKKGTYKQLTNYQINIKKYTFQNNDLYLVFNQGKKDEIYKIPNFNFSKTIFTPVTKRRQLSNILKLQKVKNIRQLKTKKSKKVLKPNKKNHLELKKKKNNILKYYKAIPPDSIVKKIDPYNYIFNYLYGELKSSITDNYQYDYISKAGRQQFLSKIKENRTTASTKNTGLSLDQTSHQESVISLAADYEPEFALDRIKITPFVDPIRGFALLTEMYTTDIFENHKINLKYFGLTDLKRSSFSVEYFYLKKRIDYSICYQQQNIETTSNNVFGNINQTYGNKLEFGVNYPYSIAGRFSVNPFLYFIQVNNLQNERVLYSGYRLEYILDNALTYEDNILKGLKLKATYEHYFGVNKPWNFGLVNLDARYYYRINQNIILATRITGGGFFGNTNQKYILGGVNNTLFAGGSDTNVKTVSVRPSDIVFTRYVNSLRGYNIGSISAKNHFISNLELRIPIISYLYNNHINSRFLRYLQLVGFIDAGTAWEAGLPFNDSSIENRNEVTSGSFDITVLTYQNPLLASYGFGLRTYLLGYYIKFDIGWRFKGQVLDTDQNHRIHFSLGYDF